MDGYWRLGVGYGWTRLAWDLEHGQGQGQTGLCLASYGMLLRQ